MRLAWIPYAPEAVEPLMPDTWRCSWGLGSSLVEILPVEEEIVVAHVTLVPKEPMVQQQPRKIGMKPLLFHPRGGMAKQVSPSNFAVTPNTANPPTTSIAPSGDVVLVIGDEEWRMRVHSLILRTSSRVFDAMLGPSYSEGANLSSAAPKTSLFLRMTLQP